jgi:hypothetical protein
LLLLSSVERPSAHLLKSVRGNKRTFAPNFCASSILGLLIAS